MLCHSSEWTPYIRKSNNKIYTNLKEEKTRVTVSYLYKATLGTDFEGGQLRLPDHKTGFRIDVTSEVRICTPHKHLLQPSVYVQGSVFAHLYIWINVCYLCHFISLVNLSQLAFNSSFRYIEDILSINNCTFHLYLGSLYTNEPEGKDKTHVFDIYLVFRVFHENNDYKLISTLW
jgi:hypothetical protein